MNNKFCVAICSVALTLITSAAHASLVNSISGGTLVAMPVTNVFGSGPFTQAPGITWSSTSSGSIYGFNQGHSFNENGIWDDGLTMVGLSEPDGTMTYSFTNTLSAVGGFINYAKTSGQPDGGTPTIAIYNSADQLIDSAILNFNSDGVNGGFFYGFEDASSSIAYFRLSNAFIGLANLTIKEGTPSAVPLPATLPLLLSGLGLLGFTAHRRRKAA